MSLGYGEYIVEVNLKPWTPLEAYVDKELAMIKVDSLNHDDIYQDLKVEARIKYHGEVIYPVQENDEKV